MTPADVEQWKARYPHMKWRTCKRCGDEKPVTFFATKKSVECISCGREYGKRWRATHKIRTPPNTGFGRTAKA